MSRDKYILATRSVAAAPRSKRRGGAVAAASRSGGGGAVLGGDYLTRAEFASYFELVNIGTDEAPRTAIHALYEGLYTDGFLSALGCKEGENGSGGVSALWELSDVSVPNPRNGDVLTYDGAKWIAKAPAATSGGLDKEELEAYLAGKNYATQSWVTGKKYLTSASLYGYLTKDDASDLYLGKTEKAESAKLADKATALATARKLWGRSFDGGADIDGTMIPASSATCGTSTSRWANVYSGMVDASTSIKIGGGTITWNSAGYFVFDSGVASLSFVSALGVGVGLDSSVGSVSLWGNTFNGKNNLTGNITVDGDGSNPMVKVVKGGRDLSLHIGGSLNRGLWSGDLNKWIMYLQSDNTKILFADNIPVQATRFISSVDTGTAPFTVKSTTRIANLNADMVDGLHAADLKGSGGLTMQEILNGLETSNVGVNSLVSYHNISCDGDIIPIDSGDCCIGEDTRPWAAGYFSELYIDGKKIDPNNLGGGGGSSLLLSGNTLYLRNGATNLSNVSLAKYATNLLLSGSTLYLRNGTTTLNSVALNFLQTDSAGRVIATNPTSGNVIKMVPGNTSPTIWLNNSSVSDKLCIQLVQIGTTWGICIGGASPNNKAEGFGIFIGINGTVQKKALGGSWTTL